MQKHESNTVIQVNNLNKKYKNSLEFAVNNLSFTVQKGEIFGLLGPNGAGKTTTINIITGTLKPTSGQVNIANQSIKRNFNTLKQKIGVVPQQIALYPTLNVYNNLLIFGNLYGIKKQILNNNIRKYLKIFGLEHKVKAKVKHLSAGMQRRLNIIAGLLHNPEILILDEPTAGIDVQSKQFIINNLIQLNKAGTTILYTSHYMEEAEKFCSHIAIIDNGNIIIQNKPQNLISQYPDCTNLEDVFIHITGKQLRE
ncbi:MAG: ABC transporter ATP-binding protein [Bacteroidetes bacterium]|nr:ABC transporter ATP-binding protein [Bacteroidota bacterium]